jgi:hypothetical protein
LNWWKALKACNATIVSGLAYGIDIVAHRTALKNDMPTIGCVAHGLDRLYPGSMPTPRRKCWNMGGLVSELPSSSHVRTRQFPRTQPHHRGTQRLHGRGGKRAKGRQPDHRRHRSSYDREVFAFPGRPTDARSEGCNKLIQQNKAALVTRKDVITLMEWLPKKKKKAPKQAALFLDLMPEEQTLVDIIVARARWTSTNCACRARWRRARRRAAAEPGVQWSGPRPCRARSTRELKRTAFQPGGPDDNLFVQECRSSNFVPHLPERSAFRHIPSIAQANQHPSDGKDEQGCGRLHGRSEEAQRQRAGIPSGRA